MFYCCTSWASNSMLNSSSKHIDACRHHSPYRGLLHKREICVAHVMSKFSPACPLSGKSLQTEPFSIFTYGRFRTAIMNEVPWILSFYGGGGGLLCVLFYLFHLNEFAIFFEQGGKGRRMGGGLFDVLSGAFFSAALCLPAVAKQTRVWLHHISGIIKQSVPPHDAPWPRPRAYYVYFGWKFLCTTHQVSSLLRTKEPHGLT